MATLQVAPTRHHHTEQFSGILTDQYLPGPYLKREAGRDGKNQSTNWHASSKLLKNTLQRTASKQATAYTNHEMSLLEALGHPQYSRKNC